jgi:hypothetical protein
VNREAVEALSREGQVYAFRVPEQLLNSWLRKIGENGRPLVERFIDFDNVTGVQNEELRFSAKLATQMQKFLVDGGQ